MFPANRFNDTSPSKIAIEPMFIGSFGRSISRNA
jgi:hypothetical protein